MKLSHLPILLGLMLFVSPAFAQTILHNEAVDGELSDSGPSPTSLAILGLGVNTVQGSLGGLGAGGGGGATNGNDADIFTFTVAAGQVVNAIDTTRTGGGVGFVGLASGNTLAAFNDNASLGAAVDYGALFGNGSIIGASATGLLPIPATLGAGDHTFILQETVVPTDFTISFNVAQAIPEPSSVALLGGLAMCGFMRRRRN